MNPVVVIPAVAVVCSACFIAGVVYAKSVVSDTQAIKTHVTAEVSATEGRLRADLNAVLDKLKAKL